MTPLIAIIKFVINGFSIAAVNHISQKGINK